MRLARAVVGLGPIDAKSVGRDPMLRWLILLPVFIALLMRWGVPAVTVRLREQFAFQLEPYYALIVSFVALIVPMLAGIVIGFLLLDQQDDGTLAALRVTPISLGGFLVYRISAPMAVSVAMTLVAVPLTGLVEMHPLAVLVVALCASPIAPIYALLLGAFARNKVQGFALMKAAGVLTWPPVIGYFLPLPWQWVVGIVPHYWPTKLFWMLEAGENGYLPYLVVGLIYQAVLIRLLLVRFDRIVRG
jgi:fluoroquinolone transport system permease protein